MGLLQPSWYIDIFVNANLMLILIDGNYAFSVETVEKVIAKGGGQCVGK